MTRSRELSDLGENSQSTKGDGSGGLRSHGDVKVHPGEVHPGNACKPSSRLGEECVLDKEDHCTGVSIFAGPCVQAGRIYMCTIYRCVIRVCI